MLAGSYKAMHSGITKWATSRSFATRMLESGYDIRTAQELLGHVDVSTTMIDTRDLNQGGMAVKTEYERLCLTRHSIEMGLASRDSSPTVGFLPVKPHK